jgi:hypothetical protein
MGGGLGMGAGLEQHQSHHCQGEFNCTAHDLSGRNANEKCPLDKGVGPLFQNVWFRSNGQT